MTAPDTLADLHELPWSTIEGAHVRVAQQVDKRDPLDPTQDDRQDLVTTEEREGTIAGRHRGWRLKYSRTAGDYAEPGDEHIVIHTAEDTYLEVRTAKPGNELLAFETPEGSP